jgi:hypothetical protein
MLLLLLLAVPACGGRTSQGSLEQSCQPATGACGSSDVADAGSPDGGPILRMDATGDAPVTADGASASGSGGLEEAAAGPVASAGCGKPWTGVTGQWVSQPAGCAQGTNNQGTQACQTIPPGAVVPAMASNANPELRGWWVLVPSNYDPQRPYPVIYEAAAEGDANYFHAGADGYAYQNVDDGQAILVGLDYDTSSTVLGDYDSRNPQSNDLAFVPWLMTEIESTLCVDTTREWLSNYTSDGPALAQQLDCAFPGRFRGQVLVGGSEPGAPGAPGSLPTCNPAPMAALFVHDLSDPDSPYASILPGCSRILSQNGCTNTKCDPLDLSLTTRYPAPAGVLLPSHATCVQFNGCPAEYPVVFCSTLTEGAGDGTSWGATTLLWDFILGLRGEAQRGTANTPTDPPWTED